MAVWFYLAQEKTNIYIVTDHPDSDELGLEACVLLGQFILF